MTTTNVLNIADFSRIKKFVRPTKNFQHAMETTGERRKMIETVSAFVEADVAATLNRKQAGEIYFRLLAQPVEALWSFLSAYAVAVGVPEPKQLDHKGKPGRPISVGVRILADVIYGAHPEFLRKSGKSDTLAGKHVAACIYEYKKAAGLTKPPKHKPLPARVPKSSRVLLTEILDAADANQKRAIKSVIKYVWGMGALNQLHRLIGSTEVAIAA